MKKRIWGTIAAISIVLVSFGLVNPAVSAPTGIGPHSGEFSAWTKVLSGGEQIKFYAKYPQLGQKIQFMAAGPDGIYSQVGWVRVEQKDLDADGGYKSLQNQFYFIRTFDLVPGKNRVRILVDGKVVWGTKTYSLSNTAAAKAAAYPACDTASVQKLTSVAQANWNTYNIDCPTDSQTPEVALAASAIPESMEPCQLLETSADRIRYQDLTVGFPRSTNPSRLPDGTHKIVVIPIQWSDHKGSGDPLKTITPAIEKVNAWYKTYSRGNVKFEWDVHPTWITLPEKASKYSQSEAQQNTSQWGDENKNIIDFFWNTAIDAADPYVDFTGVDMVFFIPPSDQEYFSEFNLWPPGTPTYQSDEGPINRGYAPGRFHFNNGNAVWMFWIHEMLHYFKLPDLYWVDQNSVKRSEYTVPGAMQDFDIMTNQGGTTKSLNGWLMWVAGWLDDQEITCITEENFQPGSFEITTIDKLDSSLKSVILRLSDTSAVVIEARRATEFDLLTQRSRDGVFIYHVDTTLSHGEGPLTILAPKGRTLVELRGSSGMGTGTSLDAVFYEGNSIDIAGYHITVNERKADSDVVSISKISNWKPGSDPGYVCVTKANRDQSVDYRLSCPIVY